MTLGTALALLNVGLLLFAWREIRRGRSLAPPPEPTMDGGRFVPGYRRYWYHR